MEMKPKLTFLTKLTAGGLVAVAIAIWGQWLSGDPNYPKAQQLSEDLKRLAQP